MLSNAVPLIHPLIHLPLNLKSIRFSLEQAR
jgi:hypothetical protein